MALQNRGNNHMLMGFTPQMIVGPLLTKSDVTVKSFTPVAILAVEPMVTAGRHAVRMGDDGWAIYSQDGSLAAHFEFTIAVTADGPRILTPWHERRDQAAA